LEAARKQRQVLLGRFRDTSESRDASAKGKSERNWLGKCVAVTVNIWAFMASLALFGNGRVRM